MKRLSRKKILLLSILTVLVLSFFLLSTIVKNYLVNHSEELIGRKLEIAELHFNYAKVSVRVNGFCLYESNDTDQFVSFNELYVNVSPWKLISGEYSVSQIYLDGLNVSVIQDSLGFNFDDLLVSEEETTDTVQVNQESKSTKFSIYDIEIKNGYIGYFDKQKDNLLDLKNINLNLPLIAWDNQKSEMGVDFSIGGEGNVGINANVDHANERYMIDLKVSDINIKPFMAYAKDYMKISSMEGKINTSLKIDGSMTDFMDVFVKGNTSLQNFSLNDLEGNRFLAVKSTSVNLDSLNIGTSHYEIGKVVINEPEIYATLFKENTNIERVFEPIMAVDTSELPEVKLDTLKQDQSLFYAVDSVIVKGGLLQFSDKTLNRDFVYDIKDIALNIGEITETADNVPLNYSMQLNAGGELKGNLNFNLQEVYDFNLKTKVTGLELMSFSPYTEFYIARPITQGTLNYDCMINIKPNHLDNQNNIKISEFDFGNKTKDPNAIKAPVRLALYLLKDQNDIIQFDLPVSGNPNEPDFKLGKIIWKTLMNFLVKTAAKPFGILGSITGTNPENIETIQLDYSRVSLDDKEKSTLKDISEILQKKNELVFSFTQETDINQERNYLILQDCVNDYFKYNSEEAPNLKSKKLENWANQSPEFRNYLVKDSTGISKTLVELCFEQVGNVKANQMLDSLIDTRSKEITSYLLDSLHVPQDNFIVKTADLRNLSDQQKKPKFRVEVSIK
ncbi:DUF748 domain-containing protein [Marinifilum sp. D714]|uniref:AsmA family protein n=1 Tax=Marinifilum sp. D714 TaxID=2937523 RepID=UPI0027D1B71A|nr:DUF748 domain-containing protein [Marinifilum sp. D714]MDQ2177202.1 DUF748 domain-containing protein [Marinifilum sp. D714]